MAYVERSPQPDHLLARLAEIAQEIEHSPHWMADDLIEEQKKLLAQLRAQGIGR
jgi:hypothetical protein